MYKGQMTFSSPLPCHFPQLRQLWKDTFGDSDAFLDMFEETAFSVSRCRCAILGETITAALYWFDCSYMGHSLAYIYAVATKKEYRNQGICHALMKNTHTHLKTQNYTGTLLVPATETLFGFYEKMGYRTCLWHNKLCIPKDQFALSETFDLSIEKITKKEFALLRPTFLPRGGILQEKENLDFLERQAEFFKGTNLKNPSEHFLLTAHKDGTHLEGFELLGSKYLIPSILSAFKCDSGTFFMTGDEIPFGMYYAFKETDTNPNYLGFCFG